MKKITKILTLTIIILTNQLQAQVEDNLTKTSPLIIGEKIEFHSKILNEKRVINVYLPNGYKKTTKYYPVIYLLDGSINEDFIHIAGLVQFASFSWINILPESIVIGIANVDRKRDFTFPTQVEKDKKDFPTTGHSEKFIDFLERELQPYVAHHFKTNSQKTLIGQSLGGLLATEILFKKPNLFNNYIIVSPSLWWNKESLLKKTPKAFKTNKSIYIAVGKEGKVMEHTAKHLYDKLKVNKKDNTKLFYQFLEKQNHGDALHLAVYGAFEKMFKME